MDAFTLVNFMNAKCVTVQFPTSPDREYNYFVPEGDDPKVGDVVMTSTSWDTFMPPEDERSSVDYQSFALNSKLARVTEVLDGGHPKATRFYMMLVPIDRLKAAHEANQVMAKKAKERGEAVKKLDKMLEKRSRLAMYEQLAAENPEAKALLEIARG